MNNVLNITERLKGKRQKEQAKAYRRQVETIHRIVQCTSCHFRCAMCGQHHAHDESECPTDIHSSEITLCADCRTEYESYLKMKPEKQRGEFFWHNKEWVRMWSTWLEFQQAVKQFRGSPEYKNLLEEPDE
jgi:hypothetical protein